MLALLLVGAPPAAQGQTDASPSALMPTSMDPTEERLQAAVEAALDTLQATPDVRGRQWRLDDLPLDAFETRYAMRPDSAWRSRVRQATVRLPDCSGFFASTRGLVATSASCVRDAVRPSASSITSDAFYADAQDGERRLPGFFVEQLRATVDVTTEVEAALEEEDGRAGATGRLTDEARTAAREAALEQMSSDRERDQLRVETVALHGESRYVAHVYRRYGDVRLVMLPEAAVADFGGVEDAFTYPRYAFDVAFLRVYDGETPMDPPAHFGWSSERPASGDPVFAAGHPPATLRNATMAQLQFLRQVQAPARQSMLEARQAAYEAALENQAIGTEEEAPSRETLRRAHQAVQRAVKRHRGRVRGLNDPALLALRTRAERQARRVVQADTTQGRYEGVIDSLAALQDAKRSYAAAHRAFQGLPTNADASPAVPAPLASATLVRALRAQQAMTGTDPNVDPTAGVLGVTDQPAALDRRLLAAQLREVRAAFGPESAFVQEIADAIEAPSMTQPDTSTTAVEDSIAAAARRIVAQSPLADSAAAAQGLRERSLPNSDPALQLAAALQPRITEYRSAWERLQVREAAWTRRWQAVQHAAVPGTPPDGDGTLRLADGVVQGQPYNGTVAPPVTTFFGLFGHFYALGEDASGAWQLPPGWKEADLNRSVPLNVAATSDLGPASPGGPLLDRDLRVVGVVFSGNAERLASDLLYRPRRMRSVATHAQGVLEALRSVYDAERLAEELQEGARRDDTSAALQGGAPATSR
jgi:hypothetical protein